MSDQVPRDPMGAVERGRVPGGCVEPQFVGEALLEAIGNTSICVFMYYPQEKRIECPANTRAKYGVYGEYFDMPRSFADDFVHDDDRATFFDLYRRIDEGAGTATATFHSKDRSACCKVTLTELGSASGSGACVGTVEPEGASCPSEPAGGSDPSAPSAPAAPREVVGVIEDVSGWDRDQQVIARIQGQLHALESDDPSLSEARDAISAAIGGQYYALYYLWLASGTYICYQKHRPGSEAAYGEKGDTAAAWDAYISAFVEPEDRPGVREFCDFSTLADRLGQSPVLSCECRRIGLGWTRMQFIASDRDAAGDVSTAVFSIADINAEKTMELARRKAVYESQHDPLTGAMNRKAFEDLLAGGAFEGRPVGFALMDVDRFKEVNDEHGHEAGDRVLATVARSIASTFREGDLLFRIGGDEFVVVLPEAGPSSWGAICRKLEALHVDLTESLGAELDVTLSVGVSFSDSGVAEWMYRTADEALFNTKRNGRSGCTYVDKDGVVQGFWRDDEASEKTMAVLRVANAAVARIERTPGGSRPARFVGGDAVRSIYGMPFSATPEECFDIWNRGMAESHRRVIEEAALKMLEGGTVECTVLWKREGAAPFLVRIIGTGRTVDGTATLYTIHRSLEGADLVELDDEHRILDAQSAVYASAIYVDLVAKSFTMLRGTPLAYANVAPDDDAVEGIRRMLDLTVSADFRAKMARFLDLDTVSARLGAEASIDCEYLSSTERGWCRASWLPVRRDAEGNVTNALLTVATIDSAKQLEMQRERENARLMTLHYEAAETLLNTKIVAIALLQKATHEGQMWTRFTGFSRAEACSMADQLARDARYVPADARPAFLEAMDPARIAARVEEHVRYTVPAEMRRPDGSTQFFEYHFTEYGHDSDVVMAVVEDVTAIHEGEGRSLQDLFDNVACCLATFEWDGQRLTALRVSEYCDEMFGVDAGALVGGDSGPDFNNIHPDDLPGYLAAARVALHETHRMHHVYRMWNNRKERYAWTQIDAVVKPTEDGHALVYSVYTDVSGQKDAEVRLAKLGETLSAAFYERVEALLQAEDGPRGVGVFDLTDDVAYEYAREEGSTSRVLLDESTYGQMIQKVSLLVRGEADRKRFLELFGRGNIMDMAAGGRTEVSMECMLTAKSGLTEWCRVTAEVAVNRVTGHVEAICYNRSVNDLRLANLLVKRGLTSAFSMVAVLLPDVDEYYLYDRTSSILCEHRRDFWGSCALVFGAICDPEEYRRVMDALDRDEVMAALGRGETPSIPVTVTVGGVPRRHRLRFSVLDDEKNLVVAALRDVTDEEADARFLYAGRHDALTGLYNRQAYFEECRRLLDEHPDERFAMLRLNVRRFRLFNASFGEKEGDRLLTAIADGIRMFAGNCPTMAYGRIDADVFGVFYRANRPEDAERNLALVGKLFREYTDDFMLEPSIGIYEVAKRDIPIESMFARASMAAQAGIRKGGFVGMFTDAMEARFEDEVFVANEMRSALEKHQFAVYLQPKYDLVTGEHAGAEALVRWVHPERGIISPGMFIPVFESNGFVSQLDRYMWEEVCALLSRWQAEGRKLKPVSVNMSRVSAYSHSSVAFLKDLVARYGVDPSLLELELTESAYIDDPEDIKRSLRELQRVGFKILMDDFGSGYSSLNTLRELPVDILKLDMRFLSSACDDPRGRTVLESTVQMTKRLNLPVIAEGVETVQQADFLRSIGCEYVQGYLYARPMPVEEYQRIS